jgi:uncharacterized glyoxalase superfamily protein PhnB
MANASARRFIAYSDGEGGKKIPGEAFTYRYAMQTIFPILRYRDARAAIRWLCAAFGFHEVFSVPENGPVVRHAQLQLATNVIMLGSVRPNDGMTTPQEAGTATQALAVYVDDVVAHYERAIAAGAEVAAPPATTDFGFIEYHASDPEGHLWTFSNYLPDGVKE